MTSFNLVWKQIENHAGEVFQQKTGAEFRYEVQSGCLIPDRTNRKIPRSNFEKALQLVPLESTVALQHLQGPSYIYAVLMDPRIRRDDW